MDGFSSSSPGAGLIPLLALDRAPAPPPALPASLREGASNDGPAASAAAAPGVAIDPAVLRVAAKAVEDALARLNLAIIGAREAEADAEKTRARFDQAGGELAQAEAALAAAEAELPQAAPADAAARAKVDRAKEDLERAKGAADAAETALGRAFVRLEEARMRLEEARTELERALALWKEVAPR